MASPSTHTIGHIAEASEPQGTFFHSRNVSTLSSVTLHTNTTQHSQPYEPLLRPNTPSFHDAVSHQSDRLPSLPRWSPSTPSQINEKKYPSRRPQPRFEVLRWSKRVLQAIMAIWALYSSTRYLIAFTIYQGLTGQIISLSLGAATGLSFAFIACACILGLTQNALLIHGLSVHALMSLRRVLYYLSSFCFLGPSIVNFALLFVWKNTADLELQARHRCRLDVDLVWSTSYLLCNHRNKTWGRWVALSGFRLLASLAIVITFHLIASSPQFMPVRRKFSRHIDGKGSHQRLDSYDPTVPQLHAEASKSSFSGSTKASPRNRLRTSRSHGSNNSEDGHPPVYHALDNGLAIDGLPLTSSNGDMLGFVDRFRQLIHQVTRETEEGLAFARSETSSSHSTARSRSPREDNEYTGYAGNQNQNHYDNGGDDDDFYSPGGSGSNNNPHTRNLNSDSTSAHDYFYPEDEHIRMMNGYVKRMPTIESMGSKELGDSLGGGSRASGHWRPPTRNTLWSFSGAASEAGSEPRSSGSRPNSGSFSLQAQADSLMAGMFGRPNASEIGELMRAGETVRMVGGGGGSSSGVVAAAVASDDSSDALGSGGKVYAAGTAGSKGSSNSTDSQMSVGVPSFHTASIGTASTASLRTKLADAMADESGLPLPTQAESSILPYRQGFGRRSVDVERPPTDN